MWSVGCGVGGEKYKEEWGRRGEKKWDEEPVVLGMGKGMGGERMGEFGGVVG